MNNFRSLLAGALLFIIALSPTKADTITLAGDLIAGGQLGGSIFTIGFEDPANDGGNHWPAGEKPDFATDGDTVSKYLNFAELNTGFIVTPAVGLSNVTGLTLTTGNDSPERDPITFSLYGSTTQVANTTSGFIFNLADFTAITIDQNSGLNADPGRNFTNPTITFANGANYTTYLLVFPTVRDSGAANSMQISEAVLSGTAVPEPGSVSLFAAGIIGLLGFRRRRAV